MVTDNVIGDVGHATLERLQLHRTAAGVPRLDVRFSAFDSGSDSSLVSHPGVSAAEHSGAGALAAPGNCATVYRGEGLVVGDVGAGKTALVERFEHGPFDLHKAAADGMTVGTCRNGLSSHDVTHPHTHTHTAVRPHHHTWHKRWRSAATANPCLAACEHSATAPAAAQNTCGWRTMTAQRCHAAQSRQVEPRALAKQPHQANGFSVAR